MDPATDYGTCHVPILFSKHISDGACRLWIWLKYRGNSVGVVRWSYKDIADQFGISERSVHRRLVELQDLGLIKAGLDRLSPHGHEIAIMPLTDDVIQALGAPRKWSQVRGGSPMPGRQICPPNRRICPDEPANLSSTYKVLNKTSNKPVVDPPADDASEGRVPFDDIFQDPLVTASESPKKAQPATRVPRLPESAPKPVIDDAFIARWGAKQWAKAFVVAMEAEGFKVAWSNASHTVQSQMTGITNFLLESLGRMDTYRLLIEWFPKNFKRLCPAVFRKEAKQFGQFPLAWIPPRLGELVERFKNQQAEDKRTTGSKHGISYPDWL